MKLKAPPGVGDPCVAGAREIRDIEIGYELYRSGRISAGQ